MGVHEHRRHAPKKVRCAVVTVSDTRTPETDTGGALLASRLAEAGHEVVDRRILRDEPGEVRAHLAALAGRGDVEAVLTTGGTGITARDSTYEAIAALLEKRLDGFGELFRMLSYQEVGSAAMLSRAVAGTYRRMVVCALPGAPEAVRLALEKLILPELPHMARLVRPRGEEPSAR
jgi:molybdenum cofactor biosynthesis protein B